MTKAELQRKLEQAQKIIDFQQQEINNLHKQYADIVSRQEFNALLKQYEAIKQRYKILQSLYERNKEKRHNERGAGRKPKLNPELITQIHKLKNRNGMTIQAIAEQLHISVGLVHKALHTR
jgi:hypothetical protein